MINPVNEKDGSGREASAVSETIRAEGIPQQKAESAAGTKKKKRSRKKTVFSEREPGWATASCGRIIR